MKTNLKMKRILSKVLAFTIVASLFTSAASVSAVTYSYTPTLNDTYDDGTAELDLTAQWCPDVTYTDEDGRGKVANVPYVSKASTTDTNIVQDIDTYISGDNYYISFDINTDGTQNIIIAPCNADNTTNWIFPLSFMVCKNGYVLFTDAAPSTNNVKTYNDLFAGTAAAVRSWGFTTAYDISANTWYNIKFLYDKTASKIYGMVNEQIVQSIDVTNWTDIKRLLIRNYTNQKAGTIKFDNFQIGTYEELLSVENCTFKNGTAVIEFSDNIDQTSLTKDTIKITGQNGKSVDYAGTYADKKYTCVINNYNSLLEYKITAEGYKGSSDKTGIKFEKTFSGDDYIYTPNMTDTFDNENSTFNWKFSASNVDPVYVDESTRGKVLKTSTKARTNAAADDFTFLSGASGASGNVSKNMTSDKANYIDFDIKFSADTNLTFAPQSIGAGWAQTLPFIFSKNGFIASLGVNGSATQYTGVTKTLMDYPNAKAAVDAGYKAVAINGQDWNNIRMVFDKVSNTASLYVNGVLLDSGNKDSAIISKIDDILIRNCDTTVNDIYIDNFEIGTAEETSLKLVNASGEAVTEFSVNDTVYALVITKNNTAADEVRVVAIASYDETNTMIDIKTVDLTTKAGKFGMVDISDNISVSASGAKTIKAYLWSDWRSIKPLCQSVGAALKQ